jgi:uncharacterized protein YcbX
VKSLRGEQLTTLEIGPTGVVGDRAYALRDTATGLIMSGKRWARLFECAARYPEGPSAPPEITLPDGSRIQARDASARLSAWLDHPVELVRADPAVSSAYEIAIMTVDEVESGVDQLTADAAPFPCGPGGFFDAAPLHLLTDATLAALGREHAAGRFDVRRFRPNVMIAAGDVTGPVEAGWVGRTVAVGDEVRVAVLMTAIRCVMTTLPQEDLPRDPKILRAIAQSHEGNAGVYALVESPGRVAVGDALRLDAV